MGGQTVWGLAVLPLAALPGAGCAALAVTYSRCVAHGAAIDGATLAAAWRLTWRGMSRTGARRFHRPSHALAALCAGLLALAGLPWALHPSFPAAAQYAACVVLLVLALVDARCGLLPDALTLPLLWAGLMLAWSGGGPTLHDAVAGAAAGYAFLWGLDAVFQVWRRRVGMGGGDMKLVAALGAWLGWAALPAVLLAACVAAVVFAVFRRGPPALQGFLAFGPFLAGSGALGLVGGPVVQSLF